MSLLLGFDCDSHSGEGCHGPTEPILSPCAAALAAASAHGHCRNPRAASRPSWRCSPAPASCCSRSTTSLVDLIYFGRAAVARADRSTPAIPRAFASYCGLQQEPGFIAIFVPAWDESAVIASMLRATLERLDYDELPDLRRPLSQRSGDRGGDRQRRRSRDRAGAGRGRRADDQGRLPQPSLRRADRLRDCDRPLGQGGRAPRRRGRRPPARARASSTG